MNVMQYTDDKCTKGGKNVGGASAGKCLTITLANENKDKVYFACDIPASGGDGGNNTSDGAVAFGASLVAALAISSTVF